jgi:hypothetical protein
MLNNDRGEYRVDDWDDSRQLADYYDRTHRADRFKDIRQRSDRFRDDTDWRPHDRWSQDYQFYGRDDDRDSYMRASVVVIGLAFQKKIFVFPWLRMCLVLLYMKK